MELHFVVISIDPVRHDRHIAGMATVRVQLAPQKPHDSIAFIDLRLALTHRAHTGAAALPDSSDPAYLPAIERAAIATARQLVQASAMRAYLDLLEPV